MVESISIRKKAQTLGKTGHERRWYERYFRQQEEMAAVIQKSNLEERREELRLTLPKDPYFWLLLAACAADNSNLTDSQKNLLEDAKLAFGGTSPEFRLLLTWIQRMLLSIAELPKPPESGLIDLQSPLSTHRLCVDTAGLVKVQRHQSVELELSEQFRTFLETSDSVRFRKCENCARLFWAKRSDQKTCDTICANRSRAKRWYEKQGNQKKIKQRRLKKYIEQKRGPSRSLKRGRGMNRKS